MMFMQHSTAIHGRYTCAASGNQVSASRSTPKAPSFISTPACSMDTAAGAAAWPAGLQECIGHIGTRLAKPRNTGRNQVIWKAVENEAEAVSRATMSKV